MKTLKIALLLLLVISLATFCLVSCKKEEPVTETPTEQTPAHVHTFANATCTAPKTCECGTTDGAANGHTWTDATCQAPKTCSVCNATEGTLAAHKNDVTLEAVAPTCTETGLTAGVKCSACGTVTTEQTVVPANGHTFVDGECSCGEAYVPTTESAWVLSTELKNGDLVLIGAPAYGKLLSAEKVDASSYYNKGVDYSTDNFANVTDAEIFVVTVNADGSYTFTSLTGDVIALAASYSSLNKDGENKTWTLTSNGDGTFLMKNVGRNTYLEWYSSKDNWSTYTAGDTAEYYISFYVKTEVVTGGGEHVHNHVSNAVAPTCTEAGYTTYTCSCGDTYTVDGAAATGHTHEAVVTDPTCTEAGYTTYTCACGNTYTVDGEAASGHNYVEGTCTACGGEDPDYHVHNYNFNVTTTATCEADGVTTYTCSCGDSTTEDTAALGHVDENLDITCDRDGCTKRILPAADSTISLFTANHMIIISLNSNYYVEGTVTSVEDARNGKFVITDEAGDTILIYLPVDENGITHANWVSKVVVGDVVRVYGKPVNPTGLNTTEKAAIKSGVLTFITKHPHVYGEPTCTKPGYCECGQDGPVAVGHADNTGDNLCDACGWNVTHLVETVTTKYNDVKDTANVDTATGVATFEGNGFNVIFEKNTASFNTNGTDHMRMNKGNKVTVVSLNGNMIVGLKIAAASSSYVDELELFLQAAGYTYTVDGVELIIYFDATESITIENTSTKSQRIASFTVIYEAPVIPCDHTNTTTTTVDATCTVAGSTTVTCTDCGETVSTTEIPATGHSFADATCTAPKTCTCGETEGEALGHTGYTDDYKCDVCNAGVEPEADSVLTIEQAIALANAMGNSYTGNKYYITGRIVDISNTFNGHFNIVDENGNKFYVYGLKSATGEGNYNALETKPLVGDTVTIYTVVGCYENAPQAKDAWLNGLVQHTEHEWVDATCDTAKHCTICGKTEGEPQHSFVEGVCTECGKAEITGKVETRTEDFAGLTAKSQYITLTTTSGWQMENCAVLVGGTTDANPVFQFIGSSDATKAVTLNGKTATVGKLTSATLSDGISKLSFNYGHAFSEKNGVNITINIIQNGEVVATTNLVVASITQKTAYTFTWELDTVVEGDFVIEFVNNCPSNNSTSNKDRVSIFNLSWDTAPIAE